MTNEKYVERLQQFDDYMENLTNHYRQEVREMATLLDEINEIPKDRIALKIIVDMREIFEAGLFSPRWVLNQLPRKYHMSSKK